MQRCILCRMDACRRSPHTRVISSALRGRLNTAQIPDLWLWWEGFEVPSLLCVDRRLRVCLVVILLQVGSALRLFFSRTLGGEGGFDVAPVHAWVSLVMSNCMFLSLLKALSKVQRWYVPFSDQGIVYVTTMILWPLGIGEVERPVPHTAEGVV